MKKILLSLFIVATASANAQNLLTQNPSFETYVGTTPTGWIADEALIEIVTDGSVGLQIKKNTSSSGVDIRVASTQVLPLNGTDIYGLKFDYKIVSGTFSQLGFIMLPDTYEYANTAEPPVHDGQWHRDVVANMETTYIGAGWASDFLNFQAFYSGGNSGSTVIIDNLAFGKVGTLLGVNTNNVISQDITIGPNPTSNYIKFFNVDQIKNKNVAVYDSTGRLLIKTELSGDKLDLSALKPGIYTLHLGDHVVKKVIKK